MAYCAKSSSTSTASAAYFVEKSMPDNTLPDASTAMDLSKHAKTSPMLLTATVLLGSTPQPVVPLWSFHVPDSRSMLTSNGNLKTFLLNVCDSPKTESAPENPFSFLETNNQNPQVSLENYKQTAMTENVATS